MSELHRSPARARLDSSLDYAAGSIGARLAGMPSVADFPWLAVGDGVTDNAAAFVAAAAATTGPVYVPPGDFVVNVAAADAATLLGLLDRIRCDGNVTMNLAAGEHALAAQVVVNSPDAHRITVQGAATVNTTAVSQVGVSGAAKAYAVVMEVASSAGVDVGDYAMVRQDVAGTGDYHAHAGVWKVTAVDAGGANRLTLLNTHHGAAFPTNTLTGGTVVVLKTRLVFTGCDGIRFEGGQPLALLDRVAIVGDWDVSAATGTTGAHGIIMASPLITGGASSNATFNMGGNAALGPSVGVSAFGEQGIAISGRCGLVANYVASCSNRKRGWYAEGGHIRAKFSVGSGNGEDGFIADTTGYLQCAYAKAAGNGLNGFWSTNNSIIAAAYSVASGNLYSGYEARGDTRMAADATTALANGSDGYTVTDGGNMDADGATADGNGRHGFQATNNGTIDANNATSTNNVQYGAKAAIGGVVNMTGTGTVSGNGTASYTVTQNAEIVQVDGTLFPGTKESGTVRSYNSTRAHYADIAVSSIGDVIVAINGTSRVAIKSTGLMYPFADNTQAFGRSTERWSQVFGREFRPGGGTPIWTSGAGTPEGAITAPIGSLFTRTDGGAVTTLYVKESGAGNTGWVAK